MLLVVVIAKDVSVIVGAVEGVVCWAVVWVYIDRVCVVVRYYVAWIGGVVRDDITGVWIVVGVDVVGIEFRVVYVVVTPTNCVAIFLIFLGVSLFNVVDDK